LLEALVQLGNGDSKRAGIDKSNAHLFDGWLARLAETAPQELKKLRDLLSLTRPKSK
jgi:hypothetical protein